jgi:hypothetical protein
MIRIAERIRGLVNVRRIVRSRAGIWIPELDAVLPKRHNVIAVHTNARGEQTLITTHNIITDAGDIYYAQKQCGQSPTNAFARLAVGTGKTAAWAKSGAPSQYGNLTGAIAGSVKAQDATYPMVPDTDVANTGLGNNVTSWRVSYTSTDFTSATNVTDGVITIASPVSGSPTLAGFTFTSPFLLATGDSIKIFVNHTMLGV